MIRTLRRCAARGAAAGTVVSLVGLLGFVVVGPGALSASAAVDVAASAAVDVAASAAVDVAASAAPALTPDPVRALVALSEVSPTVLRPGGRVVIRGTVTAPTSGPLVDAHLDVVLGANLPTRREAVDSWARGAAKADGALVGSDPLGEVAPGETVEFAVTVDAGAGPMAEAFAALPVALEVYQGDAATPTGVTRTFVAWHRNKEYEPLAVATAMPLTLDPDPELFSRDPAVRQSAWERTIGDGSRVDRIIDATAGTAVTLAVDPALFGAESVLPQRPSGTGADAPTTSTAPSTSATPATPAAPAPTPDATSDAAISVLADDLAASLAGRDLWALPYADADVAAGVDLDPANPLMRDLVTRSSVLAREVPDARSVRADVAWPADALLPNGREARLRALYSGTPVGGPAAVVVSQSAISAASDYTPTARRVAKGGTRLGGYDTRLSSLLGKVSADNLALTVQRYLADTLVLLDERPGTPRSVLVVAPRTFDPDRAVLARFLDATADAEWLKPVRGDALLADSATDRTLEQQQPARAAASAAPRPALTAGRLRQLAEQRDTLVRVATVLRDGEAFERIYREVLDELVSVRWRYRPGAWAPLSRAVTDDVVAATRAIRVVDGQKVNFLAENGAIKVTVRNDLDYAIRDLRLVLSPSNLRMQIVEQPPAFDMPAGPNAQTFFQVPVKVLAAGQVDIWAQLTTADGTPIGSPGRIRIGANPLDATIYWIGGILVGLVLIAGLVRTVRKGTSRIDEIGDLEEIAERDEAAEDRKRR